MADLVGAGEEGLAQRVGERQVEDPVPAAGRSGLGVERADGAVGEAIRQEVEIVEDDERAEVEIGVERTADRDGEDRLRAAMFAWWVTWLDSRRWPSPWRATCSTSAPANRPSVTTAGPNAVSTASGTPASRSGSA